MGKATKFDLLETVPYPHYYGNYEKATLKGQLPKIAPLKDIRVQSRKLDREGNTSGWRYAEPRNPLVGHVALQALKRKGITLIQDLEGWSAKDLVEIKGIGDVGAGRIIRCLKHAKVTHRGKGYPWEIKLNITVPTEDVSLLAGYSEEDVVGALTHYVMSASDIFPRLHSLLLAKKKADLLDEGKKLEEKMVEVKERLAGIEATDARSLNDMRV